MTNTVARAKAICPNAKAVPRLIAPSVPAKRLAPTKAPNMIPRSTRMDGSDCARSGRIGRARAFLQRPLKCAGVEARILLLEPAHGLAPAPERPQAALAVLGGEVGQRV